MHHAVATHHVLHYRHADAREMLGVRKGWSQCQNECIRVRGSGSCFPCGSFWRVQASLTVAAALGSNKQLRNAKNTNLKNETIRYRATQFKRQTKPTKFCSVISSKNYTISFPASEPAHKALHREEKRTGLRETGTESL